MSGYQIPHFGLVRQYYNLKAELLFATDQALNEGCFMGGKFTSQFENWLALKTKCEFAITVHSGTQALEIIAKYHKDNSWFEDNDKPKIYLPNLTYPATLNAFLNTGWDVELVDTDKNGLLDTSYSTTGDNQCFVGLYGASTDKLHSSGVIVDGAQHWLVADGNVGEGMAISFDPTKNLPASGNGGAIVTNNEELYRYAKKYRDNGKDEFDMIGTNSKMSELDCAHLLVRSKYIDVWQQRRENIRLFYLDMFEDLSISCLSRGFEKHADQKFVIYTEERNNLYAFLRDSGIDVKVHYGRALSELPVSFGLTKPTLLSTSVILSRGILSLPIYPELSDNEVEYIVGKIRNFFAK